VEQTHNKYSGVELTKQINKMYTLKQELKRVQEEYETKVNETKHIIKNYMDEIKANTVTCSINDMSADWDDVELKASLTQHTKIIFDADKLHERLKAKPFVNSVINKTYTVNDWQQLANTLQKYKVPAHEVTKYITVTKQVDTKLLDHYSNLGDVTLEEIQGTYTVQTSEPSLQVRTVKITDK